MAAVAAPPLASRAHDPIGAALESSRKEFYRQLKDPTLKAEIDKITTIDQVYEATKRLQEDQGRRKTLRSLGKIRTFLDRLDEYSKVLGIFVQAKPEVLALIWGPIKLLIHLSSNLVKSMDAIVDVMSLVGDKLPVFTDYAKLFEANSRVSHVLALIFRDILDFYLAALNFFALKGWSIVFEALWPVRRDEINLVAQNMEKHGRLMVEEVTLAHISKAHDEWMAAHKHYNDERQARDAQFFHNIEQHIQPISYDKRLDQLRTSICEGTADWLTKDETFNRWLDPTDSSTNIVWLQGFPGAGKTYVASRVVDHAMRKGYELFSFLRYNEEATALTVLQTLLFQLVALDADLRAALCSELRCSTRDRKRDLKSSTSFAADTLLKLIKCAPSPVYIIVDGLDEIEDAGRYLILEQLLSLIAKFSGEGDLKLLVSSRREDNIERLFQDSQHGVIRLDQKNAGCIRKYIAAESHRWLAGFDKQTRSDLESLLVFLPIDAEGMFLYAHLVMSTIKMLPPQIELIRQELRVPPQSLAEAYQRVLQRISDMPSSVCKISKRILAYIACSPLPIMVREMEQLILLDPGVLEEVHPVRASMNVTQYCGPLVEVVEDKLQFVHFTVKEYLYARDVTGGFIEPSDALLDLTETCLRYLSTDLFDEDASDDDLEKDIVSGHFRFSYFACDQWYSLTRLCIIGSRDAAVPGRLVSALEDFVTARWSPSQEPISRPFGPAALESVKDNFPEIYAFLCQIANFTKLKRDTGNWRHGEEDTWTKFDPTTLSASLSRIHHLLDRTLATATHEIKLQFHYGPGLYKCDYILCPSNRLGFTTRSVRDAHVVRHERPFKCSRADCEFAIIGFTSQKARDDHCSSLHPEIPSRQTMAVDSAIPDDYMEARARLAQLVAADRVSDVDAPLLAYATGKEVPIHEILFWEDLERRVALSGSEPMCRLFFASHRKLFTLSNWFGLTRLAIQGNNEGAMIHLLRFREGTRAVLASASLWAFDILTATSTCGGDFPILDALAEPNWSLTISVAQEPRLVGFLSNHQPFYALGTQDLARILRNVVVGSRSHVFSRFLVESGADLNSLGGASTMKRGRPYPLHATLRRASPEAAEFAKFLLLSGADPYQTYRSTKRPSKHKWILPSMELGAQDIQKWLGMTWDELVDWSQEERARRGQTVYRKLDPVKIK